MAPGATLIRGTTTNGQLWGRHGQPPRQTPRHALVTEESWTTRPVRYLVQVAMIYLSPTSYIGALECETLPEREQEVSQHYRAERAKRGFSPAPMKAPIRYFRRVQFRVKKRRRRQRRRMCSKLNNAKISQELIVLQHSEQFLLGPNNKSKSRATLEQKLVNKPGSGLPRPTGVAFAFFLYQTPKPK